MGNLQRKRRRSATAETSPRRQFRRRASATTTEDAAPLKPPDQTEMQTAVLEKISNLMQRTRTIESYVCAVFITKRDSSVVYGTFPCQQLCKESGAAFS